MRKYLLPEKGNIYKANLHCHSNISDGRLSPEELKKAYKEQGYSILAYTDHDVFVPHHDLTDEDFLALAGFELQYSENGVYPASKDLKTSHFCFIAKSPDIILHPDWNEKCVRSAAHSKHLVKYDKSIPQKERNHSAQCINESVKKARDAGFFITYNHPTWSLDEHKDYIQYEGMFAMEIFNNDCSLLGYNSYVPDIYDEMLRSGKRIYAVATDDNHNKFSPDHPKFDSFGGFIMIKAPELKYEAITDALFAGNFYASQGPEIYDLYIEDDKIHITCSNVQMIALNTGIRSTQSEFAPKGESLTEAVFSFSEEDKYLRITIKDAYGKYANTSAYFTDEFYR